MERPTGTRSRGISLRSLSAARDEAKANKMNMSNKSLRSNEELLSEIEKIVNRKRGFTESRSEADMAMAS
jgi:acetolactate synthase regulatory subunit